MSLEKVLERIADVLEKLVEKTEPPTDVLQPFEEAEPELKKKKKEEKPAAKTDFSIDDVRKAAKALIDKKPGGPGFAKAQELLKKFGAVKMADLAPSNFSAIIVELKKEAQSK